jgi:hypothetical protein
MGLGIEHEQKKVLILWISMACELSFCAKWAKDLMLV